MLEVHFILYVQDQARSREFYARVLGVGPVLDVPGMTQFRLSGGALLGLMPESGIKRILGESLPDPSAASGVPRSELYLVVEDPEANHSRALAAGAIELSPLRVCDWGDVAGYSLDPDGHVLAFATKCAESTG